MHLRTDVRITLFKTIRWPPGHCRPSGATGHTRNRKDQHLSFYHSKFTRPSLCMNQTFLGLGQCEYIHHSLVVFAKKRLNRVYKYLKQSTFRALTERHLHGPSSFTPSCNLQTRTASPQSSQVPQSYPVTDGCGCEEIISLSLLSGKR